MTLPVTGLAAAICALLLIYCAFATVRVRIASKIGFGDGGDPGLLAARGAHGNLAEHAPIFLIMLGMLELANAHHYGITAIAALFLAGRVAHIIGMNQQHDDGPPRLRQIGVITTWLTMAALALWIVVLFVRVNL